MKVWWQSHEKKVYEPSVARIEKERIQKELSEQRKRELRSERYLRNLKKESEAYADTAWRECRVCGKSFIRPWRSKGVPRLCPSAACRETARIRSRKKSNELHGKKPSERARKLGLPYDRGCGPISICTRDKWRCQLCGVSTPRRLRGTYDMRAPEVDHIIPFGAPNCPGHVWSNVQCACRKCNIAKSVKPLGQMRLAI